jgi:hypothetical protein
MDGEPHDPRTADPSVQGMKKAVPAKSSKETVSKKSRPNTPANYLGRPLGERGAAGAPRGKIVMGWT